MLVNFAIQQTLTALPIALDVTLATSLLETPPVLATNVVTAYSTLVKSAILGSIL
jgi:hypothetical protein